LLDRVTGRSLTPRPGRVGLVLALVPEDPEDPAVLVVLHLVHPGDRVDLTGLVVPHLLGPVVLHLGDRADLMGRAVLVVLHLLGLAVLNLGDRVVLVATGPVDRVAPVNLTSRVDRVAPVDRVELTSRAAPADLVGLAAPDLTVPVGRAAPVDRRLRRTSSTVSTTGVARSGVVRGTHRTDSARRITARRLRRATTDSGGTMDLLLALSRPTGTAHRLQAAGTGRRLLAAGTIDGTGRLAT
jgi:hypothetical protein